MPTCREVGVEVGVVDGSFFITSMSLISVKNQPMSHKEEEEVGIWEEELEGSWDNKKQ